MKCFSCGSAIAEASKYCPECGEAVPKNPDADETIAAPIPRSEPRPPSSQPRSSRISSSGSLAAGRFLPGALLLDRYRIVALLGQGGMGEVYRADDLTLGQQVALKFLPETFAREAAALDRFRNEVRLARQVSHPNVCRVYDIGECEGHVFLSMEYVDGEDLGSLARRIGRLPADKGLEVARKLCAGLAAVHEKGVLHRDLKPANVMLDSRGQVLLTDFGLAQVETTVKQGEARSGTPAYMAPEQLAGEEVTVRSDIYSLGVLLYELFTGKRPFEADTLGELLRLRTQTTPTSPSTLVRDLDPAVERVVLRCLDPDPARRPSSALAVASALPGGDPLAAALAAGETPSPQVVAAAGEGARLASRLALPLFAGCVVSLLLFSVLAIHNSAIESIRPEYSSDVLTQKARDILGELGYARAPEDEASGFYWKEGYLDFVTKGGKAPPRWDEILSGSPCPMGFWYRQSPEPMTTRLFGDSLLTPGVITRSQPPPIESGMAEVDLDAHGRLTSFSAVPPQRELAAAPARPVNWAPLFAAAGLDSTRFADAEPQWNSLAASDTRAAWTGKWPGTERPLRVEAAAWRGKPVYFSLTGEWSKPDRMADRQSSTASRVNDILTITLFLVLVGVSAWLARRNFVRARGDRHGAFRLATWVFYMDMGLWLLRGHFVATPDLVGVFVVATSTSLFSAALVWALYLALEPYIRRHWPQTIISWSRLLAGRVRDPIVGRDVLFGVALGLIWGLAFELRSLPAAHAVPTFRDTSFLEGTRSVLAAFAMQLSASVTGTLGFFFLMFLLRVLLRNKWLAGGAFTLIFVSLKLLNSSHPWLDGAAFFAIYAIAAVVIVRFGLVAIATGIFTANLLLNFPPTGNLSAWYFPVTPAVLGAMLALAAWSFHTSLGGQKLWDKELFE